MSVTPTKPLTPRQSLLTVGLAIATLLLGLIPTAEADDAALYARKAPPGSAFIRIFNNSHAHTQQAAINNLSLKASGKFNTSPYQFLPAKQYQLTLAGITIPVSLEPDHAYTFYLDATDNIVTVEGAIFKNKRKALIEFYNLTSTPLTLKTSDGKVTVIEPVSPQSRGFREINAVNLGLSAFAEGRKLADAKPIQLKRAQIFSLFAISTSPTKPALFWATN